MSMPFGVSYQQISVAVTLTSLPKREYFLVLFEAK